ncbi:MAG: glycosyltransferase [Oceanococcus sp.]
MQHLVVQVVQHLRPGGLESVALNLAEHSRYPHQLISLDGDYSEAVSIWERLSKLARPPLFLNKPAGFSWATLKALRSHLQLLKPFAVHTHHIGPLFYSAFSHAPRRLPLVHTEHDAWHLQDHKARRLQELSMRWSAPQHVSVGQHVASSIKNIWPRFDTRVIANSVDMQRFTVQDKNACRDALGLPSSAWIIACAARLETVKGVDVLLKAHAMLPDDCVLAIGGLGSQADALRALSHQLGTQQRVHFLGHVEQPEKLYGAADLYCQPSRNEGLPLAPIEAQACGTPCVISDVGASAQISGWPGTWSTAPDDADALAQQLQALYRQSLPSPRESVRSAFNIEKMSQAYDTLYQQVARSAA